MSNLVSCDCNVSHEPNGDTVSANSATLYGDVLDSAIEELASAHHYIMTHKIVNSDSERDHIDKTLREFVRVLGNLKDDNEQRI